MVEGKRDKVRMTRGFLGRALGFGLWALGFGLWALGFGAFPFLPSSVCCASGLSLTLRGFDHHPSLLLETTTLIFSSIVVDKRIYS
jgi:hypothetical protein